MNYRTYNSASVINYVRPFSDVQPNHVVCGLPELTFSKQSYHCKSLWSYNSPKKVTLYTDFLLLNNLIRCV